MLYSGIILVKAYGNLVGIVDYCRCGRIKLNIIFGEFLFAVG